jgi:hypothetical protein
MNRERMIKKAREMKLTPALIAEKLRKLSRYSDHEDFQFELEAMACHVAALSVAEEGIWLEFCVKDMCSLCGQAGIIDTRGIRTPANFECGGLHYCICPNGRALKAKDAPKEARLKQARKSVVEGEGPRKGIVFTAKGLEICRQIVEKEFKANPEGVKAAFQAMGMWNEAKNCPNSLAQEEETTAEAHPSGFVSDPPPTSACCGATMTMTCSKCGTSVVEPAQPSGTSTAPPLDVRVTLNIGDEDGGKQGWTVRLAHWRLKPLFELSEDGKRQAEALANVVRISLEQRGTPTQAAQVEAQVRALAEGLRECLQEGGLPEEVRSRAESLLLEVRAKMEASGVSAPDKS